MSAKILSKVLEIEREKTDEKDKENLPRRSARLVEKEKEETNSKNKKHQSKRDSLKSSKTAKSVANAILNFNNCNDEDIEMENEHNVNSLKRVQFAENDHNDEIYNKRLKKQRKESTKSLDSTEEVNKCL